MTTVLLFFIVISVLIVIHEFGHFIAARAFNVRVEEFALGFPPRIASVVRGETRYSINAIPIGGYVKLTGEEDPTDPRSLATRSIRVRVTILLAGIFMNLALTLVLFAVFFTFPPEVVGTQVIVARVEPGSPPTQRVCSPETSSYAGTYPLKVQLCSSWTSPRTLTPTAARKSSPSGT